MTNRFLRIVPALCAVFLALGTLAPAAPTSSADPPDSLTERNAEEPLLMLVSLRDQSMRVFSGDRLVARSNVSTGKQGHTTPTGVFSVLEKRRHHHSNIYSRAPMPFMQRLTWSGIALHESDSVPGYPASHGCVRLPGAFAERLYRTSGLGAHVVITDEALQLRPLVNRNLFYPPGFEPRQEASSAASPSVVYLTTSSPEADKATETVDTPVLGGELMLRTGLDLDGKPAEQAEPEPPRQPLRILITRRTGREMVRDIQSLLNELGHGAGDVDGLVGPDTGSAIVRFQKANDLQPTGTVSVDLARQLHEKAGRTDFSTGHIYVRRGFKPLFDAPVALEMPEVPLGTHFLSALTVPAQTEGLRWVGATLPDAAKLSPLSEVQGSGRSLRTSIGAALARIDLPEDVRARLDAEIVPGSSLVITDHGISDESHKGTDFVVLTRPD